MFVPKVPPLQVVPAGQEQRVWRLITHLYRPRESVVVGLSVSQAGRVSGTQYLQAHSRRRW